MKKTVQFKMLISGEHASTIECSSRKSKRAKRLLSRCYSGQGKVTFTRNKPV